MSVELKCRSYYSFLRGGSSPEELIREASRLGVDAIAITDLHGVYGMPRAWHEIQELQRENQEKGTQHRIPKLLCGGELVLRDIDELSGEPTSVGAREKNSRTWPSVVLIARNRPAYGALCRIFTEAHGLKGLPETKVLSEEENPLRGEGEAAATKPEQRIREKNREKETRTREKGQAWLSSRRFVQLMRGIESWGQGLYPRTRDLFVFPQWEDVWGEFEDWNRFDPSLKKLLEIFAWVRELSPGQVRIPLRRAIDGRDELRTELAQALAKEFDAKIVAHNDIHYHDPRRRAVQDVVTCIREGVTLEEAGFRLQSNSEKHLKPPAVMQRLFSDLPEALTNADEVAQACTFLPSELRYRYPSEWIPEGLTAQSYLEKLCVEGVLDRYPATPENPEGPSEKVKSLLAHELSLIAQLGFADYFLTVYDIVKFARSKDILCQGRGSAANSIVCYVLGVTAIDPVRMNLLFERFISVERGEPPDIDVDFEHERREEVIQYIYTKYGRDRAAMVAAVVTYGYRSGLREAAKTLGLPVGTLSARRVEKELLADPALDPEIRAKLEHVTETLEGFPRHLSIHSGGFTLSADPIIEIVPVEPATMEGRTVIQWDKQDLDVLGLLKVDVLSLGMLTALKKSLDRIGLTLANVPAEDRETYRMIQKADTVGTFQIESRAQMAMLPRLKPENFYELVVEVAIVRPGPIVGKMVHPYLKRKRGEEAIVYPHPELKTILGKTFGVPIFQEQVMKIAVSLAGFTPGEADRLRRAIGAWRSSGSIDEMGRKLMDGLIRNNVPQEFAERIFQQIHGFAEYGFPESHAASFALIAYASCFVKRHYPAEFLYGLINSQPMGFYAPHTLVDDAKRHGVTVLPLSLHRSTWDSELLVSSVPAIRSGAVDRPGTVRIGFHQVQGMNEEEYASLDRAREALRQEGRERFASLQEFASRVRLKPAVLRTLALGDAFTELGLNQREALWQILSFEAAGGRFSGEGAPVPEEVSAPTRSRAKSSGGEQLGLFSSESVREDLFSPQAFERMDGYEEVLSDYQALRLSTRAHPMAFVREKLRGRIPDMNTKKARQQPNGRSIRIPGLSLVMQRPPTAAGTAFATLEDEFGFLDLVLRREVFQRVRDLAMEEPFLVVRGQIQRDGDAVSLVVKGVEKFLSPDEDGIEVSFKGGEIGHPREAANRIRFPETPGAIARRFH